jgi:hypothetical protein
VRSVFADTFYWIALLNPEDPDHDRVTALISAGTPALVTTEEVLSEFLTYFSGRGSSFAARPRRSLMLWTTTQMFGCCHKHPKAFLSAFGFTRGDRTKNTA